jgi:hypothetical protein
MLFFLEVITFKVSLLQHDVPGMNRYPMMYLMPMLLVIFAYAIKDILLNQIVAWRVTAVILSSIMLGLLALKYQTYHRMETQHAHSFAMTQQYQKQLAKNPADIVCVLKANDTEPNWSYLYELVPHRVRFVDQRDRQANNYLCKVVIND